MNKLKAIRLLAVLLFNFIWIIPASAAPWTETKGHMKDFRVLHTATLLSDGRILLAGGANSLGHLSRSEIYDSATGTWSVTGELINARERHTATLLKDGRVLLAGGNSDSGPLLSSELYDPATETWMATGNLGGAREFHTATLLTDGNVLVVGGSDSNGDLASAEIYNPTTETWTPTGSLGVPRVYHTATLLNDGRVLVAGGMMLSSSEIYDPATGTWTATGNLTNLRISHTAILLADGRVLVAGGAAPFTHSEIYDPTTGNWSATGNLGSIRYFHTATLLSDGKVLVAGGLAGQDTYLDSSEIYDPDLGTWSAAGDLVRTRGYHSATLLPDGKVLVAGGARLSTYLSSSEIYDPADGAWTPTVNDLEIGRYHHTTTMIADGRILVSGGAGGGNYFSSSEIYNPATGVRTTTGSLGAPHAFHTATLLADGRILVAGGQNDNGYLSTSEIYNPSSGMWTVTGDLVTARVAHTATLLYDGRVLVAGGEGASGYLSSSEIYDPATSAWTTAGDLGDAHVVHTATLLTDGRVLLAGGANSLGYLSKSKLYDPATGIWSETSDLLNTRGRHSATLLADGTVLVAGGEGSSDYLFSSEIYNPSTGTWMTTGNLASARYYHTATFVYGRVLVAGGIGESGHLASSEIYNPATGNWTVGGELAIGRKSHTATLLTNGKVLVAGGEDDNGPLASIEICDIGLGFDSSWCPVLDPISSPLEVGPAIAINGSGFLGISEASGGNSVQNSSTNYPLAQLQRIDDGKSLWLKYDFNTDVSDNNFTAAPITHFPDGHAMLTVFTNGIPSVSKIVLVDNPPAVSSIERIGPNPTNASSVAFSVELNKHVSGIDIDDFALTGSIAGGSISEVSGSGASYMVAVNGYSGAGTLRLDVIDNDTVINIIGTPLGGTGVGNGDYSMGEVYEIDQIAPILASASVWLDGISVDIIFSEQMAAEVTTPGNYTISGPGQGNLPPHPDQVVHLNDNTYRLIWNPGDPYARREMLHGGDITITVSNVYDSVGNPIGSSNSDTDYGGGIGLAPETTALPPPSVDPFTDSINVELICDDGEDGSGCAAIYYTTNGEDPTTASPQYSNPIEINEYTELKFMAVDNAGNTESINTQVYHIEKTSEISCELSTSSITYGDGFTVSGKIDPAPNNPNQGVSITLYHQASGTTESPSTSADEYGNFNLNIACDEITEVGEWSVYTYWPGDASHLEATSGTKTLTVNQASATLSLDVVMSEAIKINSHPPIGGSFSPEPFCGDTDLTGIEVTLYATEPLEEGGVVHELKAITQNRYGQFLLDYETAENDGPFEFNVPGEWTLSAAYTENPSNYDVDPGTYPLAYIRVVPTAGYAIVVQGRVASGEGMPSHHKTTSFVYEKLKDRQLLDDDIQYLSWLYSDGWDGDPSRANIQHAITEWARDKMDENYHPDTGPDEAGQPGDLYIIMVDHGWTDPQDLEEGVFFIYPDDPITSTEFAAWINELQGNLTGAAADRNVVVILGFCRAGAFMDDLAASSYENRVVIASADKDEASHRGPQDVDDEGRPLRDGEYFVSEFFKSVSYGKSIKQSFEQATTLTEAFTSTGSGVTNAPYYDDSVQHPLLDDNSDGIGSNELTGEIDDDGDASEFLFIGASPPEGNDPGDVLVTKVAEAQFIEPEAVPGTVDLWAEVDNPVDLGLIWIEVKAPNYDPVDPGEGFQIEMETFKKATATVHDEIATRYLWSAVGGTPDPADLFELPGMYQIFYFAKDKDSGHVSP
ncbi:kelch repeat-containing protein, partial [Thermodesulfobacteriota bacterium]